MAGLRRTRRQWLTGLAASLAASTAGCGSPFKAADPETPSPTPSYRQLNQTSIYVAPELSLSLPERLSSAPAPGQAGVVILSGSTDVEAETSLDWLTSGAGVALLGAAAERTLIQWLRSDAYRTAFDHSVYAEANPDPDLVIAFAVGREFVSTHRFRWGNSDAPTDHQVVAAINEALRERPTPQG